MPLQFILISCLLALVAGKGHEECLCPRPVDTPPPLPIEDCPGNSASNPAASCALILACNPSAPSGYYWISSGSSPPVANRMYCYMEADKCGVKGVMRVAHIDMKDTAVNCPKPLTQYNLDSGRRLCGSANLTRTTCDSVIFPTHEFNYQHVCGRAVGFSYHHPCGFWYGETSIEQSYVSGLSITHGLPGKRSHIWTYAGGFQERYFHFCNCPCAHRPGARSPPFVCQDFHCDTATRYPPPENIKQWFTNNTLWDGENCYPGIRCCNNALAPWFRRTLQKTTDDIEVRWYVIQHLLRDRVGIELLELYVY